MQELYNAAGQIFGRGSRASVFKSVKFVESELKKPLF